MLEPGVRNVALIDAAQQEIAIYGRLRRWPKIPGLVNDVEVLEAGMAVLVGDRFF